MQMAHARLAHRGVWALNEKRMLQWSDLSHLTPVFGALGTSAPSLLSALEAVRAALNEVEVEIGGGGDEDSS